MNLDLQDKRALVCGSTQGIGRAVAKQLAVMGADITLLARDEKMLLQVVQELYNDGSQKHDFICADFNNPDEVKEKVEKYIHEKNQVHILVNNTGGPKSGPVTSAQANEFTEAFNIHLLCNHILAQACMEGMKSAHYGRIINIISTSVKQPIKGLGVSNTVRAAVANWSKTLAGEVGQFGITVNNILPGATNTTRLTQLIEDKSRKAGKSFNDIAREMMNEIPAGRFGEAEEIANAVAFLASPASGYISGINLPVDGGRTGCL
ncbi:MAG: SDR family oxidoreductase [Bacteroidia bacterium]